MEEEHSISGTAVKRYGQMFFRLIPLPLAIQVGKPAVILLALGLQFMSGLNNHFIISSSEYKELVVRYKEPGRLCTFGSLFADSYYCIVYWFPHKFHLCPFRLDYVKEKPVAQRPEICAINRQPLPHSTSLGFFWFLDGGKAWGHLLWASKQPKDTQRNGNPTNRCLKWNDAFGCAANWTGLSNRSPALCLIVPYKIKHKALKEKHA